MTVSSVRLAIAAGLAVLATATASACGGDDEEGPARGEPASEEPAGTGPEASAEEATMIAIHSPDFEDGGALPVEATCEGEGAPPRIEWSGVPDRAAELVLVARDPDAPSGTFHHWSVFGIPPSQSGLAGGSLPAGAGEGTNDFGDVGYGPACPPEGDGPHRYLFTVYALPAPSGLSEGAGPDEVLAVDGEAIARGTITGTYER